LKYRTKTQEYEAHLISQARGEMAIRPYGSDGDYEIVASEDFMAKNDPVTEVTPRGRDFRKDVKDTAGVQKRTRRTKAQKEADDRAAAAVKSSVSNGHQAAPAPEHELVGSAAE
jgi:hypothetical protein